MEDVLYMVSTASFVLAAVFLVLGVALFFKLGTLDAIRFMQHKVSPASSVQSKKRKAAPRVSGGGRGRGSSVAGRGGGVDVADGSAAGDLGRDIPLQTVAASAQQVASPAFRETSEDPTSLLRETSEDPTSLLRESSEDPTSLLGGNVRGGILEPSEEPTSILRELSEEPTSIMPELSEEPTSILPELSEEPTSILDGTTPWQSAMAQQAALQSGSNTAGAGQVAAVQDVAQQFEPVFMFNLIHNEVIVHTAEVIQ